MSQDSTLSATPPSKVASHETAPLLDTPLEEGEGPEEEATPTSDAIIFEPTTDTAIAKISFYD